MEFTQPFYCNYAYLSRFMDPRGLRHWQKQLVAVQLPDPPNFSGVNDDFVPKVGNLPAS